MLAVIQKISRSLEMMKNFSTGYTTSNNKAMIVNVDGVNYKLTIEKINDGDLTYEVVNNNL